MQHLSVVVTGTPELLIVQFIPGDLSKGFAVLAHSPLYLIGCFLARLENWMRVYLLVWRNLMNTAIDAGGPADIHLLVPYNQLCAGCPFRDRGCRWTMTLER